MADKNGWAAAVGSPGGKSRLASQHPGRSTKSKKHRTSKGMVARHTKRTARG